MRSFKQRLAALEALEAAVEDGLPPVAALTDEQVLIEVCYALDEGTVYTWHDRERDCYWLCEIGLHDVPLELWYRAMLPRVQPLVNRHTNAIAAQIPPNNGDDRVATRAVLSVLGQFITGGAL